MAAPVTQTCWFPELEGETTPFERVSSDKVEGIFITMYKVQESARAELAERVMRIFLAAHPEFCPCFSIDRFHEEIVGCPRVVINGKAICISEDSYVPPQFKDCLSFGSPESPVRCSRGHIFELSRVRFWIERNGDHCPIPPDHSIGTPQVDEYLAHEVKSYRVHKRRSEEQQGRLEQHQAATDARLETEQRSVTQAWVAIEREQRGQQIQLEYMISSPQQKVRLVSDITKIGAKVGVYVGSKAVKKIASKVATIATGQLVKQAPKVALFGIPLSKTYSKLIKSD